MHAELRAAPGDVAIEGIDFRTFAVHQILSGGGNRTQHLRSDLERSGQARFDAIDAGQMDVRGSGYGENFVDDVLDHSARVLARGNLSIPGAAERGNRIECAIPDQLGPQLAIDIV